MRRSAFLPSLLLECALGGAQADPRSPRPTQCTVVLQSIHPRTNEVQHLAINACLAPLVCLEGKHCITVEGIGNSDNPHPLQERMFKLHGSQCGFCTPGIVRPSLPCVQLASPRKNCN